MALEISYRKLRHYWPVYLLILVPLALVLTFNYFPIFNGFIHIFYRWDGNMVEEFVGFDNIIKLFHDVDLWKSFGIVGIFIVSNLLKMLIPIITAVVLHHIINDRASYVYRIMFVIPMICTGYGWLPDVEIFLRTKCRNIE